MGGELKQILENQRRLEEQFEQLTTSDQLKEQAYSLNATAQGRRTIVLTKKFLSLRSFLDEIQIGYCVM